MQFLINIAGHKFIVTESRKSAVAHVNGGKHLVLAAADENFTWDKLTESGIKRGALVDAFDDNREKIFEVFELPTSSAVRIEMNEQQSATRQAVHLHLLCAPEAAWGKDIRRSVDSALPVK